MNEMKEIKKPVKCAICKGLWLNGMMQEILLPYKTKYMYICNQCERLMNESERVLIKNAEIPTKIVKD
jgi:hypothetical protein